MITDINQPLEYSQLSPLEINPRTGEPFLRLTHLKNIILTPPRQSDIACYGAILNDPRVHHWLTWPTIPFSLEDAEVCYASARTRSDIVLSQIADAATKGASSLMVVDGCPVRAIREVQEDGEEVYLGDIDIYRCGDGRKIATAAGARADDEEMMRCAEQNMCRAVGDPNIVWYARAYLKPSHHGQHIMTDVYATLLRGWAVPRMGVRRIITVVFAENRGSIKVVLTTGFTLRKLVEDYEEIRGQMRNYAFFEWKIDHTLNAPLLRSKL